MEYHLEGRTPRLTRIKHPHDLRLSGILQLDPNSLFYFIPRNADFDDMNPYAIPEDIQKLLEEHNLFPYSLLKEKNIDKLKRKGIN